MASYNLLRRVQRKNMKRGSNVVNFYRDLGVEAPDYVEEGNVRDRIRAAVDGAKNVGGSEADRLVRDLEHLADQLRVTGRRSEIEGLGEWNQLGGPEPTR